MRNSLKKSLYIDFNYRYILVLTFFLLLININPGLAKDEFNLTILHTNDIHGRLESFDYSKDLQSIGGIARRATIISTIKTQNPNVLLLDAGDAVQGSTFFKMFNGIPDIKIMSKIGYDAAVPGNHEFDKGIKSFKKLVNSASFPYTAANLRFIKDKSLDNKVKDYVIKDYNGFKVGIIGITTDDLKTLTNSDGIQSLNETETVKNIVGRIKDKVDFIIVLSHIGLKEDIELAGKVPEIDLIVGGHSHSLLDQPKVLLNEDDTTLIVQAWQFGMAIGKLDLTIKDSEIEKFNYNLIPVLSNVKPDVSIEQQVNILSHKIELINNKVIGQFNIPAGSDSMSSYLTIAGSLITESMRYKYPNADIYMQNSGGIRMDKLPGDITIGNLQEMLPFDNKIIKAELLGSDIKSVLETSSRYLPEKNGAFMQTSGLTYTIDLSGQPQQLSDDATSVIKEGSRIKEIKVNGIPIDDNKYYSVVTNDFILNGGDGFSQFKRAKNIKKTRTLLRTAVRDYIKLNSPVSISVKDKINLLNYNTSK